MTAVGFEPTPLRTGAWSQHFRPLGQTVLATMPPTHVPSMFRLLPPTWFHLSLALVNFSSWFLRLAIFRPISILLGPHAAWFRLVSVLGNLPPIAHQCSVGFPHGFCASSFFANVPPMFRMVVRPMLCPSSVNFPRRAVANVVKKLFTLLDLCVSSLRRGHANLLCIVPILTDDPRRESKHLGQRCAKGALGKYVLSSIVSHSLSLSFSLSLSLTLGFIAQCARTIPNRIRNEPATNQQRTRNNPQRGYSAAGTAQV